jgi:uncharacterized protein
MEKKQIVFIHGGTAFTHYDAFLEHLKNKPIDDPLGLVEVKRWQPTLRDVLIDSHDIYYLAMPNKQNAKYLEWKIWFERHFEFLREEVVLIGHSLGGYFLAKYLSEERMPVKISALYLLAAPFENDDFGGEDGGDFAFDTKNLRRLSEQTGIVYIIHSKDDPIVPYAHAHKYREALPKAKIITFENKGHFNLPEFPEFFEYIQNVKKT